MKRFICWLLNHRWMGTGVSKQRTTTIGVTVYDREYQCRRCRSLMWE